MGTQRVTGQLAIDLAAEIGCTIEVLTHALAELGIELRRAAAFPAKPCRTCGHPFLPRSPAHLYCEGCNQVLDTTRPRPCTAGASLPNGHLR